MATSLNPAVFSAGGRAYDSSPWSGGPTVAALFASVEGILTVCYARCVGSTSGLPRCSLVGGSDKLAKSYVESIAALAVAPQFALWRTGVFL